MTSSLLTKQGVSGIIQPVAHQGSVIQNAMLQDTLPTTRKRAYDQLKDVDDDNPRKKHVLRSGSSSAEALFAAVMYELAFRDPPSVGFTEGRGTVLQQPDTACFTAFNNRDFDENRPPQFVGLVDKGQKPDINGRLESKQLAIAMKGTRSTFNTSFNTIHAGDHVYWDYPETDPQHNKPMRPSITGIPDDKLIAITVGLPSHFLSTLKLGHLCYGVRDANPAATLTRLNAMKLPMFLRNVVHLAMLAGQMVLNPDFPMNNELMVNEREPTALALRLFPDTMRRARAPGPMAGLNYRFLGGSVVTEAYEVIQRKLREHEIGFSMNVSLSSKQLDLYIRGG